MMPFDNHNVRRFMAVILAGYALMGWAYLSMIVRGDNPVTENLFGPAVYAVPGWFWASFQGTAGTLAALGAVVGRRRGAIMTAIGSLGLVAQFTAFSALATEAADGTIIVIGSAFISLPGALVCAHFAIMRVRHGGA